eukprot:scaffold174557_cov32-Tisochrysis_lutea.AAC.5
MVTGVLRGVLTTLGRPHWLQLRYRAERSAPDQLARRTGLSRLSPAQRSLSHLPARSFLPSFCMRRIGKGTGCRPAPSQTVGVPSRARRGSA